MSRLIDADELKKSDYGEVFRVVLIKYSSNDVLEEIELDDMPTAYNVDKVVEELENMLDPQIEKNRCMSMACDFEDNCTDCVLKAAIEIVKVGVKDGWK
ncbi:hypothetical protein [Bacillus infantis]|uniref:hypothetical protein n=1 Tax=Bacillus infantis TaxID=324767 RepID=UPI003CEDA090